MKIFIWFLFGIISFSLYAEEIQIVLDPFDGGVSKNNQTEPSDQVKSPNQTESSDEGKSPNQTESSDEGGYPVVPTPSQDPNSGIGTSYTKECVLEETETGWLKNCTIKNISYTQCIEMENDYYGSNGTCGKQEVTREFIDELILHGDFVDVFSESSPVSHDCFVYDVRAEGSYSESCHPIVEEDSQHINDSISSEEMLEIDKVANEKQEANEAHSGRGIVDESLGLEKEEIGKIKITVPESVEKATSSVGRVVLKMRQGADEIFKGIGSGFFIKDAGGQPVFITNYHVFGVFLSSISKGYSSYVYEQDWFSENSNVRFYVEQEGDQSFRIKGVRDMSLLMDLAVLEVDDYEGSTLSVADDYSDEAPAYIIGYPGAGRGDLQKIKTTNSFKISTLYTSFMVSHDMDYCFHLGGVSGSPALNASGEVIGVAFSMSLPGCRDLNIIPLSGFQNVNIMSSLKTSKVDIADLIEEQEFLFYNQLVSDGGNKKDMTVKAMMYAKEGMLLSDFLNSLDEESLLNIHRNLSDTRENLDEETRKILTFLVQKNIIKVQGLNIRDVAQLGSVEAKSALGMELYNKQEFKEAYEIFQELVQLRIPVHLYLLSRIYYEGERNFSQACSLLTYAREPVEALDDLYQEYDCDEVLGGSSEYKTDNQLIYKNFTSFPD